MSISYQSSVAHFSHFLENVTPTSVQGVNNIAKGKSLQSKYISFLAKFFKFVHIRFVCTVDNSTNQASFLGFLIQNAKTR